MRRIITRAELVALAEELGVRACWHEPDEQSLTATVEGTDFDNAGFWPAEMHGHTVTTIDLPREGATRWVSDRHEYRGPVELNVILWRTEIHDGRQLRVEPLACVNLATLCAWATGLDDETGDRIDWHEKFDEVHEQLSKILRNAEIEHPLGLVGVRDLVAQCEKHLARIHELEDQLAEVSDLTDRLALNPNVSSAVVAELREALDGVPAERLTESKYRSKIAREIYSFGDHLERTAEHRGVGLAAHAIVNEVGDRVGQMPKAT